MGDTRRHLHQQGRPRDEASAITRSDRTRPSEGLRWLGTFHSIAAQILRCGATPNWSDLKSSFTILDTDDQLNGCLKQLHGSRQYRRPNAGRRKSSVRPDRPLEEPRPGRPRKLAPRRGLNRPTCKPRPGPVRRSIRPACRQPELPATSATCCCTRMHHPVQGQCGRPSGLNIDAEIPLSSWSTNIRTPTSPSISWLRLLTASGHRQCLLRRRRRSVDLWLARGRGGQHPALRKATSLAPKIDQAGAELSLDQPTSSARPRA